MSNIMENLQKILSSVYGKDVRQAIHDSIHDCYEDGKVGATDLIAREELNTKASKTELDVERKRIDSFVALPSGSTTGNAELLDIRVGFDGGNYNSAGNAVRNQVSQLFEAITNFSSGLVPMDKDIVWNDGYIAPNGYVNRSSQMSAYSNPILLHKGEKMKIGTANSNIAILSTTDKSTITAGSYITVVKTTTSGNYEEYVYTAENDVYIVLCIAKANYKTTFYGISSIKNQIDNNTNDINDSKTVLNVITEEAENLLDMSKFIEGKIINSSGVVVTDNSGAYFEQFIPVNFGQKFVFSAYNELVQGTRRVYYFDNDKNLKSRPPIYINVPFKIPENIAYITIQTLKTDTDCRLNSGTEVIDYDYTAIDYVVRKQINDIAPTKVTLDRIYPIFEPDNIPSDYEGSLGYDNVTLNMTTQEFLDLFYEPYIYNNYVNYKVTKKSLGQDSKKSYDEMFYYIFEPNGYSKTVLLSSGMNTCELNALFGLGYFIKSLMESNDEGMIALKRSTRFIVLPFICPSSFDESPKQYLNSNGVRINKNFNYLKSWDVVDCNGRGTKGDYPDSEMETIALKKWLNEYNDADLWIDCHGDLTEKINVLCDAIFSSGSVINKINPVQREMREFYREKGYFTDDSNALIRNAVENGTNYPKTLYAYKVFNIPCIMVEQYAGSTSYGASGNKQNEPASIKNYVTILSQYCMAMLVE